MRRGAMGQTRYPDDTVEQAFDLFDQGISLSAIERTLHVSRKTLARWRDNQGWEERREGNREAAGVVLDEEMRGHRRVELGEKAQEGLEKILDSLRGGPYPMHVDKIAKAALDMTKTLNLLVGAPTEVVEERIITVQDLLQVARERPALTEGDKV